MADFDPTPYLNNIQGAIGAYKAAGTPADDQLRTAVQQNYDHLNANGYFNSPDGQSVGHVLRAQSLVTDPTQGGGVQKTSDQKFAYANSLNDTQREGLTPAQFVTAWGLGQSPSQYKAKIASNEAAMARGIAETGMKQANPIKPAAPSFALGPLSIGDPTEAQQTVANIPGIVSKVVVGGAKDVQSLAYDVFGDPRDPAQQKIMARAPEAFSNPLINPVAAVQGGVESLNPKNWNTTEGKLNAAATLATIALPFLHAGVGVRGAVDHSVVAPDIAASDSVAGRLASAADRIQAMTPAREPTAIPTPAVEPPVATRHVVPPEVATPAQSIHAYIEANPTAKPADIARLYNVDVSDVHNAMDEVALGVKPTNAHAGYNADDYESVAVDHPDIKAGDAVAPVGKPELAGRVLTKVAATDTEPAHLTVDTGDGDIQRIEGEVHHAPAAILPDAYKAAVPHPVDTVETAPSPTIPPNVPHGAAQALLTADTPAARSQVWQQHFDVPKDEADAEAHVFQSMSDHAVAQGDAPNVESYYREHAFDSLGKTQLAPVEITDHAAAKPVSTPMQPTSEPVAPTKSVAPPTHVVSVPTSSLSVDPDRFQYKILKGQGGQTGSLNGVENWNPLMAGVQHVWRDPADGKTYVVNGHNRHALATKLGVPNVDVRYIDAPDAKQARMQGALVNIAEGQGTAFDAAKLIRDSGMTPDEMRSHGVNLKGRVASQSVPLANLADPIFHAAVRGEIPTERAAIIGDLPNHADQIRLVKEIGNRNVTNADVRELVDAIKEGPTKTGGDTGSMFGDDDQTTTLAFDRASVASFIRSELAKDKGVFGQAAKNKERLERGNNTIDADTSARMAQDSGIGVAMFDKSKNLSGEVSNILNDAARRIGEGENPTHVKQSALDAYRESIAKSGNHSGQQSGRGASGTVRSESGGVHDAGPTESSSQEPVASDGTLFQSDAAAAKGSYTPPVSGARGIVRALRNADLSTALHESFHSYVHTLADGNRHLAALEDYIGAKRSKWTEANHEHLARAWERYFHDGEAPNSRVAEAFKAIKAAMVKIYSDLANSPIRDAVNPKLRDIFDNIIGKDSEPPAEGVQKPAQATEGAGKPTGEVSGGSGKTNADGSPKYAGSINLNRIGVTDDGKQRLIIDAEEHIATHRDYPESLNRATIQAGADALGLTPDKIASWPNSEIPQGLSRPLALKAIRDQVKQASDRIMAAAASGDKEVLAKAESDLRKVTPVAQRHLKEWGQTGAMLNMEGDPYSDALGRAQERQAASQATKTVRLSTRKPSSSTVSQDEYLRAKAALNQKSDTLYQMSESQADSATKVGIYHYENGAKSAAKWEAAMKADAPSLDAEDLARVRSNVLDEMAKSRQTPESRAKVDSFADDMARTMGKTGAKDFINELTIEHPGLLNKIIDGKPLTMAEHDTIQQVGGKYETVEARAARNPSMSGANTVRAILRETSARKPNGGRPNTLKAALSSRKIDPVKLAELADSEPNLKAGLDKLENGKGDDLSESEKRAIGKAIDDLRPTRIPGVQKPISMKLTSIARGLKNGEIGFDDAKGIVAHILREKLSDEPDRLAKALADVGASKDGDTHDLANRFNKWITPGWNTMEGATTKLAYYVREALLSGPRTLGQIFFGHGVGSAFEEGLINPALAVASRGKYANFHAEDARAAFGKGHQAIPEALRIVRRGPTDAALRGIDPTYRPSDLPGKTLPIEPMGGAIRVPTRTHSAVFHVFGQMAEEAARRRLARLWANRLGGDWHDYLDNKEVIAAAKETARQMIYTNPNKIAQAIGTVEKATGPVGRVIGAIEAPYREVPLNIIGRGFEYAGGGVPKALLKYAVSGKERAAMSPNDLFLFKQGLAKSATRGIVGPAVLGAAGAYLAAKGILNPPNSKNYEYGSINYHGNRYDINRYAPVATGIEFGGEMYVYLRGKDADFIAPFADSPFSNLLEQTQAVQEARKDSSKTTKQKAIRGIPKVVGSVLSTFVPTLSSQIASTTDANGVIRVKKGILDASINKVPGLREHLGEGKYPQSSNFKSVGVAPSLLYPGTVEKGPTETKSTGSGRSRAPRR